MAKLYFKYGAMGSSKSAQALITQFNYEELGMSVWLIKPSTDTRDGADVIRSRIGLERRAQVITPEQNIVEAYREAGKHDVIRHGNLLRICTPAHVNIAVLGYDQSRTGFGTSTIVGTKVRCHMPVLRRMGSHGRHDDTIGYRQTTHTYSLSQ